jgi:hypothetical protein
MRVPYRVLLLVSIFVLGCALCAGQAPAKEPTASIAGHVTMSGKSAPGITVVAAIHISYFENKTLAKTTTDEDGNYKLTGLTAGHFSVFPLAKSYVVLSGSAYKDPGQEVNVAEGETIAKIDFSLVRGGVVTGRITDAEGHPLIGERVSIVLKDSTPDADASQMNILGSTRNQTDDRGVYRVYGLGPGSYKVSVGQASAGGGAASIMGMGGSQYLKTFYPGVADEAKATIIELKEGAEVPNVDISVGKPGAAFSVSGRAIEADSGKPVASLYIGHALVDQSNQQVGGMDFTGNQTDANGKFRLEGLRPGHYAVYTIAAGGDSSTYSEPVTFDIADSDVTGIEIKVRRGATINGVAVLENNSDPAAARLLQTVSLYAYVEQKGSAATSYAQSQVSPDGSFHMAGLAPGKGRIGVGGFPAPPKGLTLVRTEIDGVEQKDGIELAAGAQVNGVRLVFAYGTGSVRGEVKIESGPLPDGMSLGVRLQPAGGDPHRFNRQADLDARLHFVLENIPPGNYELVVFGTGRPMAGPNAVPPVEFLKQTVTIANGNEVNVNLVVDVSEKPGGQP